MGLSCKKYYCRNPRRLPAKVISIGNLTLGGTGKTPAVIAVAQEAKERGHAPCILTRGYWGKTKGTGFVSRGEGPLMGTVEAGDEASIMAETLRNIPVVKGKDRYKAGLYAINNLFAARSGEGPPFTPAKTGPLFILDDGYQHWKLQRDADVLLIDGTNPFGNGKLFPEGIMREPFSAIRRAHIIVITKADNVIQERISAITDKVREYNREAPLYTAFHKPSGLIQSSGAIEGIERLVDRSIYAFSGIANPSYFQETLSATGARVAGMRNFRDHHRYSQKDMDKIKSDAAGSDIITTEKDLVKLRELNTPENLFALKIDFTVDDDFYTTLFKIISPQGRVYRLDNKIDNIFIL